MSPAGFEGLSKAGLAGGGLTGAELAGLVELAGPELAGHSCFIFSLNSIALNVTKIVNFLKSCTVLNMNGLCGGISKLFANKG